MPVSNAVRRRRPAALASASALALLLLTTGAGSASAVLTAEPSPVVPTTTIAGPVANPTPADPPTTGLRGVIRGALASVVSISLELPTGKAAGTGFVITADGQIATNAHVIADATKIVVTFVDGSHWPATVVGVDRTDDLAVIHIDRRGLRPLPLGRSGELEMGDAVVAIGNALDLTGGPTATAGIVSALDRSIVADGEHLSHLIQTDAAINPGNSGGPLLTMDGKVVGINSASATAGQNIGFAIAIDTALPIISQLQQGKTVTRAYLGVVTGAVDDALATRFGLDVNHGLLVAEVVAGSAAEAAGIKAGDVIVALDGTPTDDSATLGTLIQQAGAGATVVLTVRRAGVELAIPAVLAAQDA